MNFGGMSDDLLRRRSIVVFGTILLDLEMYYYDYGHLWSMCNGS